MITQINAAIKEIKGLHGDVRYYAAQVIPRINDEIVKNSHLWVETSQGRPPRPH